MKRSLVKRLSGAIAAAAVALTGAFSALPAAHAASTYTLAQVGGTASFKSMTYKGNQIAGTLSNGMKIPGITVPATGYGQDTVVVSYSATIPTSTLNAGDKVQIPVTYPLQGESLLTYTPVACSATDITVAGEAVARLTCSGNDPAKASSINLTMLDAVSHTSSLDINSQFQVRLLVNAAILDPNGTYLDENQWISVGGDKFSFTKEKYTGTIGGGTSDNFGSDIFPEIRTNETTDHIQVSSMQSSPAVANKVLRGDYTSTSPQVTSNNVEVTHLEGQAGFDTSFITICNNGLRMSSGGDYFDGNVLSCNSNNGVDRKSLFTQKNLPADSLKDDPSKVETLLGVGQYAIINNSDGSVDIAVNYGPYYNNILNRIPSDYTYPATQQQPDKGQKLIERLRDMNYGMPYWTFQWFITPQVPQYAQTFVATKWSKMYGETRTTKKDIYWNALSTSSGGERAQALISYKANATVTGSGPANQAAYVGDNVTVANNGTWQRTGYSFNGWNTKADGKGTAYVAGSSFEMPRNGVVLYAQWKINNYSVSFDKNAADATGSTASLTGKAYNSTVTLTANGFARKGYTFGGWNTKADGTGTKYADKASFKVPASNTTLYAQWTPNTVMPSDAVTPAGYVKVTFAKGANGTLTGDTVFNVKKDTTVTLKAPTVKPATGYTFSKWDKVYTNTKFTANTTITAQYTAVPDTVDGSQAKPDGYVTVTFNKGANGASLTGTSSFHVNPTKSVSLTAPKVSANAGWKFSKWDKAYTNTKFTANTTITAQYTAVPDTVDGSQAKPDGYVTVTFNKGANGASLSGTSSFHVNPTKSVSLTAPKVTANAGWKFSKWDKAYTNTKFTGNTTITAQYVAADTVSDKVKDSDGQPVDVKDKNGKDVSDTPVDSGVKVTVDDLVKCKSARDTGCAVVNPDGTVTVRDDENGNPPTGVTVTTEDTDGDGDIDKVTVVDVTHPDTVSDKIKDGDGNPVDAKDKNGKDVSDTPVDSGVKVTVDDSVKCKSARDTGCAVVNPDGTVTVRDDENGNPPANVTVIATDKDKDGDVDEVIVTGVTPSVVDGNKPKPAGYVTVTFNKGAHGTLTGTSAFHVNPVKAVTLKAPTVKPVAGWKFSKWDKAFANTKFTADTTVTALYVAVADSVGVTPGYEDKPGSDPNKPAGYVTVTFNKGAHGTLTGTSSFHVNPAKAVTLKAPTVKPVTGWKFSKWDKAYTNTKFTANTTITALYVVVDQCAAVDVSKQERVYRLYNPVTSEHLFTTDANEYRVLAAKHGWKQERVAWVGPNSQGSSVGVYRLYNAKLGDHHYTKDKNEARTLVAKHGWVYDNGGKPLFYSEDNASCSRVPVYRQYNPGLKTGQHHYTADANERETLVKKHGWKDEQIGWYAVSWK